MAQGGDFTQFNGKGGESIYSGLPFGDENFILRHTKRGLVSMANSGPDSNQSQFFITFKEAPWLDNKHTVFGRVTNGMDVCTAIENVKTDHNDKPLDEIRILSIDLE